MSPQAVAFLGELEPSRVDGVPWVCTGERGGRVSNLQRAWRSLRKRAGLDDVRLHDLRHSAASDMGEAGLSLPFIGQVLGHKSPQTTARYTHFTDGSRKEAARVMGEQIERSTREGEERLRAREQQQRVVGADDGGQVSEEADVIAIGDGAKVIPMRRRGKR